MHCKKSSATRPEKYAHFHDDLRQFIPNEMHIGQERCRFIAHKNTYMIYHTDSTRTAFTVTSPTILSDGFDAEYIVAAAHNSI
jgi:hypothetical protein